MFEIFKRQHPTLRQVDGELRIPYGVTFLDEALGGVAPGDVVLVGAKTGVGKTQFASHVALNAGAKGKRVHYFALEAEQFEIEARLTFSEIAKAYWLLPSHRRPLGRPFRYGDWRYGRFADDELICEIEKQAVERVQKKLESVEIHYRPKGMTVTEFLEILGAIQLHCDLLILDHFHYFDWEISNEYNAIRDAVKRIRTAALEHKVPMILIAHLRKSDSRLNRTLPDIDDFHGSGDLTKICTSAILIARGKEQTQSGNAATHFYIAKSRSHGDAAHYVGTVGYNQKTGTYDSPYYLGNNVAGEVQYKTGGYPAWAINVMTYEQNSIFLVEKS